ncbi:copper homeostasis protein CutC [Paenibacillus sp. sgz302251]|uniref:copper homeostasis protein CutC n=1 Tax=Paenibacillus sp. sgz302251 TaxID=3414493 RepID=UPI003C7B73F9
MLLEVIATTANDVVTAASHGADRNPSCMIMQTVPINQNALEKLLQAAGERPVTFHRAFDEVKDPEEALALLVHPGTGARQGGRVDYDIDGTLGRQVRRFVDSKTALNHKG